MIEYLDNLEVLVTHEGEYDVAGAEAWMHATVDELLAQQLGEALSGSHEAVCPHRVGDVVEMHAKHCVDPENSLRHRGSVCRTPSDRGTATPGRSRCGSAVLGVGRVQRQCAARLQVSLAVLGELNWCAWPAIISTSSGSYDTKTGSDATCASVLPVQYQSRSLPPGPQPRRSYSPSVTSV